MSAPASRPVHPCVLSLTDGSRGAEHSVWAHITTATAATTDTAALPNLVTASACTITVYSLHQATGSLQVEHTFTVAGSVVYLAVLKTGHGQADALLVAFAGSPRLTVLQVVVSSNSSIFQLQAASLLDLTPALQKASYGAVTVAEQDAVVVSLNSRVGLSTVACILGGGVAVAVVEVAYHHTTKHQSAKTTGGWVATEPYILPLGVLSQSLSHTTTAAVVQAAAGSNRHAANVNLFTPSLTTGFGDIVSATFLGGYLEPVLVLLHSEPGGCVWSGRLGRQSEVAAVESLHVTAVSVSVVHGRTAVLWSHGVPADSMTVDSFGRAGCIVKGVNALTVLEGGSVQQVIAVNGWARSTCPESLTSVLTPNPVVKLAVQLDGSDLTWLSPHSAIIALRTGQLYVLQRTTDQWTLLPTGQTLGGVGEVAHLSSLPFEGLGNTVLSKLLGKTAGDLSMGLIFAGSRMGDSLLLGYALESVNIPWKGSTKQDVKSELGIKEEVTDAVDVHADDEYDQILCLEEDALYAPVEADGSAPDLVPPSDEDDEEAEGLDGPRKRPRVAKFTVVRSLAPLDSLVNLGPLGPSCEGPLSHAPSFLTTLEPVVAGAKASPVFGASAYVFPAGYGSSGSIALVTVPGRDDRMILAEEDCLDAQCVFSLSDTGVVLLGIADKAGGGTRALKLGKASSENQESGFELSEVDLEEWCSPEVGNSSTLFANAREVFQFTLLQAGELSSGMFTLLVSMPADDSDWFNYAIAVLQEKEQRLEIQSQFWLDSNGNGSLLGVSPFTRNNNYEEPIITFSCNWSSGKASVVTFGTTGLVNTFSIPDPIKPDHDDHMEENEDGKELELFYQSQNVVAMDIFKAPKGLFDYQCTMSAEVVSEEEPVSIEKTDPPSMPVKEEPVEVKDWSKMTVVKLKAELKDRGLAASGKEADLIAVLEESDRQGQKLEEEEIQLEEDPNMVKEHLDFDDDDAELYGPTNTAARHAPSISHQHPTVVSEGGELSGGEEALFVSVCRQSGCLEIYSVPQKGQATTLLWATTGCGHGSSSLLDSTVQNTDARKPRSHAVSVREIRFFACGPSASKSSDTSAPRSLCLAVGTTNGDLHIYTFIREESPYFQRVSMRSVARPSQEQSRHHAKLLRKKIVEKNADNNLDFRYGSFYRFSGISNQDGLFAAVARPVWLVAERGKPTALFHRTRHAAPAGGKSIPISGFCSGLKNTSSGAGGFLTLHERVGRVGSQRLTAFHGLSTVFNSHGLLPGGGVCIQKIPVGVTVRKIHFIDNPNASTGDHPLYAVLVSRELEEDQSDLNDDGLTPEERQALIDQKEAAKIKRQVEADLGGFDMESEWVEEIERENCFKIDTDLGGAPPLRKSVYSVWVVDAASNWTVVDSFELDEHEHGMTMKIMNLSVFPEEPGSATESSISEEDLDIRPFIVIGTGIVDHNGEDVGSKGRVLLLEVKRPAGATRLSSTPVAELTLCYEKNIFHGPVSTVGCLSAEGKHRLVIGAGSDVNIEQWGNDKLTQVGFFRATMQVLDIMLFKNFFLLSDAYDSLYFLVWRESDKSLTLLAKDYDPIPVYAAGVMSRGAAMTFVCHDDRQNLQFFQYAPGEAAARGGNKLVSRADYHLGTQTIAFSSHFCRSSLLIHSATPTSTLSALKQQDSYFGRTDDDQRLAIHFGTTDGGVGVAVPLSEPVYWRLTALQSVMANALESNCALNQRAWRLYRRTPRRGGCRSNDRKKGVIDGELLFQYADLPLADQEDLASAIGSTVDLILDNILDVQCASLMV